jgi:hypothetical protein
MPIYTHSITGAAHGLAELLRTAAENDGHFVPERPKSLSEGQTTFDMLLRDSHGKGTTLRARVTVTVDDTAARS